MLYPVWINKPLKITSIDKDLAEMAFNTHISWTSMQNTDVAAERSALFSGKTARERYNFASSISFVLSIQYKLRSIHLRYDSPKEGARRFAEILERRQTDPASQKHLTSWSPWSTAAGSLTVPCAAGKPRELPMERWICRAVLPAVPSKMR